MRFSWTTKNNSYHSLVDVKSNYKNITKKFCEMYYPLFDNNFFALEKLYKPKSLFLFIDEDLVGFNSVKHKMLNSNIQKFIHHKINVSSQPIGTNSILITTNGTVDIVCSSNTRIDDFFNDIMSTYTGFGNHIYSCKFFETIILKRNNNNKFYIYNTIFSINKNINTDMDMDIDMDIDDDII
uniref:Nuclear transport factor 2 domain protein n=1 Tax=Mimivirus LCMiAC02 TaxID=2506609 RepID=A0A481Z3Q2_9VIRU|nr:MAG: nuclear transport factor 2 domain protein [Mimivirus LCMiAC02]